MTAFFYFFMFTQRILLKINKFAKCRFQYISYRSFYREILRKGARFAFQITAQSKLLCNLWTNLNQNCLDDAVKFFNKTRLS